MQPLFEHRLRSDGAETRALELEGEGPGRVLLHGWGDSAFGRALLLVWGTRDRMVPHTGARILLDALPETRVELLEGVGHCPQLEATERLLELLLRFPAAVAEPA